jgi:undecaprenyl-diphosphatase
MKHSEYRHALIFFIIGVILFLLFTTLSFCMLSATACSSLELLDAHIAFPYILPIPVITTALFFTYLGNSQIIIALALVAVIWLWIVRERYVVALFSVSLLLGGVSSTVFKNIFLRDRPAELFYNLPRWGSAFPSGHALMATVFYGFIGYCCFEIAKNRFHRVLIAIGTVLLIFLIGFSRIILGVHWFSDVVGGWLLGTLFLACMISLYKIGHVKWHKKDFPHGLMLLGMLGLVALIGFWVVFFYVTHPVGIRSTITLNQ